MTTKGAIVLVLDGLGAGFVGPYGNTWVETPALNRLAAESLLLENVLTDSPKLESVYNSYWLGRHALSPRRDGLSSLSELCQRQGVRTRLITDDAEVARHPLAERWDEVTLVETPAARQAAFELELTGLAQLAANVVDRLARERTPAVTWIHAQALVANWDAPYELRLALSGDEDPEPPRMLTPPAGTLAEDHDPDEVWGLVRAYAAQAMAVDYCVGTLLDVFKSTGLDDGQLLILTSPRGYPLGEHRHVGLERPTLHGELLHVPCLVRLPDQTGSLLRSRRLSQPADVFATILDWLGIDSERRCTGANSLLGLAYGNDPDRPDRAVSTTDGEMALRTPGWFLRREQEQDSIEVKRGAEGSHDARSRTRTRHRLYVKPDDRWEANEISDRCAEITAAMDQQIESFGRAAATETLDQLPPLDIALWSANS